MFRKHILVVLLHLQSILADWCQEAFPHLFVVSLGQNKRYLQPGPDELFGT